MSIKEKFSDRNFRKKFITRTVTAVILIAALVFVVSFFVNKKKEADGGKANQNQTALVTRGNVSQTITGSGSLEPYERYEVIPLVNGEIISSPFEVGDFVEQGAVIYEFDKTDAKINLEKQRNSMQSSTITYNESMDQKNDLYIKAPCSGVVQKINVSIGDEITSNKEITQIINTQVLLVKLPFNKTQVQNIGEGDIATLTSSAAMSSLTGKVTNVSQTPVGASDGASLYYVTVEFSNPGAVSEGDSFSGSINGITSPGSGTAEYKTSKSVISSIAGTVASISYKEGDYVSDGAVLVRLTSDTVNNNLEKSKISYDNAKLDLKNQENQLEDYSVTSPISGTVLIKNSKAGDTIDKTNQSVTMMVIGDVSKLKFTLSIDELDVAKVQVGQKVNITADAVEGKTFEGEITNIAMEGTAANGVTTYEAEVTIYDPQELKPSMNVDAVVVVESAENVLRVESSNITSLMDKYYVFVKNDGSVENKAGENNARSEKNENHERPERAERANLPEGEMPEFPEGGMPEGEMPEENFGKTAERHEGEERDNNTRIPEAPEGFVTVEVTIGVQGDDYTEIISGLKEGQEIYQKQVSSSGGTNMSFGMGGGMPGGGGMGGMGGMSGGRGGMGGGMPGGR